MTKTESGQASKMFLKMFSECVNESNEQKYKYDANIYYSLLIFFGVKLTFNNQGQLSAKAIQEWCGASNKNSFKRYLCSSWGKNATEGFSLFENEGIDAYTKTNGDIWLSAYMAWSYVHWVDKGIAAAYSGLIWDAIKEKSSFENVASTQIKGLQEEGFSTENVVSLGYL